MATPIGSIKDPTSVLVGSSSLTGVLGISWSYNRTLIQAQPADGEIYAGAPALGSCTGMMGSITFLNPIVAQAAEGLSGDLSFNTTGVGGHADEAYGIQNAVLGAAGGSVMKDAPAGAVSIPFAFGADDPAVNPVTHT